jgi:hypothetical protein
MSRTKILVVIALVASAAVLLVLLLPRTRAPSPVLRTTASGITLYGYAEGGALSWVTHARDAEILDEEGALSHVTVEFASEANEKLTATSDRLVLSERGSTLSGSVVVEREDGLQLRTDALTWEERAQTLTAGSIHLQFRDIVIEGEQFLYDLRAQRASLTNGAQATLHGETPLYIRGEQAEQSGETFGFSGNVVVESDRETYQCQRLESDAEGEVVRLIGSVEAWFTNGRLSAESAEISRQGVSASGGVSVELEL